MGQVAKEARRQMREQEKIERQEAARRERELRTQQLMEARKKRQVPHSSFIHYSCSTLDYAYLYRC